MKSGRLRLSLILILAITLSGAAGALAVPPTITYQGLLSEDGELVTGTESVTFRIFGQAEGGTALWEETQTVEFDNGAFAVILGRETAIPATVFTGQRRWLSVTIAGESEMLPRPEIVSVAYAFRAETAGDAKTLDGRESWEYAGAVHTHDSRYYTISALSASDGDPPNEGSNLIHWDLLRGVPPGIADGIDDTAEGLNDHGLLTGLSDDDHTQYAQESILKNSDGTAPNEGSNQVHWDNLTGVPAGFADSTDDITTDASLIASGSMDPQRITGTAVTQSYGGLLTEDQKDSLTSGGITDLHYHNEIGDVSSVTAGQGLSGGGLEGDLSISHASDASAIPNAHHYAPVVAAVRDANYVGDPGDSETNIVTSLSIVAPDSGFLQISFSGMQVLDLWEGPVGWEPQRYIAEYGVAVNSSSGFEYFVRSSMYDTEPDAVDWVLDEYLPQTSVSGTWAKKVDAGSHSVYLLTRVVKRFDSEAQNRFYNPSLVVTYFPFGEVSAPFSMAIEERGAQPAGSSRHDGNQFERQ